MAGGQGGQTASLANVGEFELIEAIAELTRLDARAARGGVRVGIGDDAAVVDADGTMLLTTDSLVEGVHFLPAWLRPEDLGRRVLRVGASDIAAMGGRARYVLLSLGLPTGARASDVRALVAGLVDEAGCAGASLVGGNLSRAPGLSVTVTVIGKPVAEPITRAGARPGDTVLVTGTLGGAAAGVELLAAGARRGALVDAYRRPPQRLDAAAALARAGIVTAMIDVSDGLAQDLGHVCRSSGVCAVLDVDTLPLHPALMRAARRRTPALERPAVEYAVCGGEDYELLFTVKAGRAQARAVRACAKSACPIKRVGEIVAADGGAEVRDRAGRELSARGFSHFGASRG